MSRTSLYRHYSKDDELLYIGISLSAINRLKQHEQHSTWFDDIARVEVEHFDTRSEARAAERAAIKSEKPKYNKHHTKEDPPKKETRFQKAAAEMARRRLVDRIVSFEPFYKIEEAARVLGVSTVGLKKKILGGEIDAVVMHTAKNFYKGEERTTYRYGITGWQLVDYLERMEQEKGTNQ